MIQEDNIPPKVGDMIYVHRVGQCTITEIDDIVEYEGMTWYYCVVNPVHPHGSYHVLRKVIACRNAADTDRG